MSNSLEIVFQDEHCVAINKPHGLMVHRSKLSDNNQAFALQELRNQLNQHVHPAHRLDRKTSGVLLFCLSKESLTEIRKLFEKKELKKTYLGIVRGFTEPKGTIDYSLKNEKGVLKDSITHYRTLEQVEINLPFGKHQTSRYSLLEITPETGRMHQIRRHMAHIFHPLIGDRPHGCNKQNKLFLEKWNMNTMLLHAATLEVTLPWANKSHCISAKPQSEFINISSTLGFKYSY